MASHGEASSVDRTSNSNHYAHSSEGEEGKRITRRQPPEESDDSSEASEDFLAEPNDSELSISEWEGSEPETEEQLRKRKDEKRRKIRKARHDEKKKVREARKKEEEEVDEAERQMSEVKADLKDSGMGGSVPLGKWKGRR